MILKQFGKGLLGRILAWQVQRLRARHPVKVIAVAGSVGKTTTKMAIARMLEPELRLRYQSGNYNDLLTVPLVFFGQAEPSLYNPFAWLVTLIKNARMISKDYPYDAVVVELGIDGPSQMKHFAYVQPDIVVLTALTEEHMAYFKTRDVVAHEELLALSFSKQAIINIDDSPAEYLAGLSYLSYGAHDADYRLVSSRIEKSGRQTLVVNMRGQSLELDTALLGLQGAKSSLAAAAVADLCGIPAEKIVANAERVEAFAGRMRLLHGLLGSIIIDDSYYSSPAAVEAALDVLYKLPNKQKIAILGSMNEMGDLSAGMHEQIGAACDPDYLQWVVTIGRDARDYLAPAAAKRGCQVQSFTTPYDAGKFVRRQLEPKAAVLVKGSQFRVFSEEATKLLLANPVDADKLVRQSADWMALKQKQFGDA